jgi:hypothetical protein
MVIEFDRKVKRIVVSHMRIWEQSQIEEKEAVKKNKERKLLKRQLRIFKPKLKRTSDLAFWPTSRRKWKAVKLKKQTCRMLKS